MIERQQANQPGSLGSISARFSGAGNSISIAAVPSNLPCVSIRKERLTASRALYSMKFKAPMRGELKSFDARDSKAMKKLRHAIRGQFAAEECEAGRRVGDNAQIRMIPFVAAAGVGDLAKCDAGRFFGGSMDHRRLELLILAQSVAERVSIVAGTSSRGTSVGQ